MNAASPTLANWRNAPFNRTAFRHVEDLLPTASIANDAKTARPWPEARSRAFDDFRLPFKDGESLDLDGYLARTHTDGFLVASQGRIVLEWMAPGMQVDTSHILMSASKSVVGLLCGAMAGQGLLDVDALVSRHVPEIAHSGYAGATIRQLLDMRTDPGFDADELARYAAATHWDPLPAGASPQGLHRFFAGLPARDATHGGVFRYLSANTDLLAWVMERAASKPFAELASELLWSRIGAQAPAAITLDWDGAPRATGGLCATLRDFARVGQLVLDGGACDGAQVVPSTWIDDIAQNGDREAWAQGEFSQAFGRLPMHYRAGWYVMETTPQVMFAMGIHGQHLFVDRAHGFVIAKLSSQPDPLHSESTALNLRAVGAVRACLAADLR